MRSLRNDIQAADAEIDAGLGKRYANGTDLFNEVMNEG
jgi:antitoxin ParD1/3/4